MLIVWVHVDIGCHRLEYNTIEVFFKPTRFGSGVFEEFPNKPALASTGSTYHPNNPSRVTSTRISYMIWPYCRGRAQRICRDPFGLCIAAPCW
mmetsp:Transcript_67034/g.139979  ORF Transcript_67034/g.139979 Transcript_67034/m.139979 type:complete len:93 (-) Transcript_67034:119-397(-)